MTKIVSILGTGWVGLPLAQSLKAAGYTLKLSTSTPAKLDTLRQYTPHVYELALTPRAEGTGWADFLTCDVLVITVPPQRRHQGTDFNRLQLQSVVDALPALPGQVLYTSSTGIYRELSGNVDESADIPGQADRVRVLVEGEELLRQALGERLTRVRFGGLMGHDRIPAKYWAGKEQVEGGNLPVNYLHRQDAVGVLHHLIAHEVRGAVFNAVAPEHPTKQAVFEAHAQALGYAPATFATAPSEEIRVVASDKIQDQTGYQFIHPDPLNFPYQPPNSVA